MPIDSQHTEQLFQKVSTEDDYKAFEQLFHLHYDNLCKYAVSIVQLPEVAEEIVSDVFHKIWSSRREINIKSSFKAYLSVSVRNRALDYCRSQKQKLGNLEEVSFALKSEEDTPEQALMYEELYQKVEQAIASLAPQCQIIFKMNRYSGLKYREIAEELGISIKTVETQMGRALKQLKKMVDTHIILICALSCKFIGSYFLV